METRYAPVDETTTRGFGAVLPACRILTSIPLLSRVRKPLINKENQLPQSATKANVLSTRLSDRHTLFV